MKLILKKLEFLKEVIVKKTYWVEDNKIVNPNWDNAEWKSNGEDGFSIMDVVLNVDKKTIEFGYNAYSCDSSFDSELKISFCPFCGRKL